MTVFGDGDGIGVGDGESYVVRPLFQDKELQQTSPLKSGETPTRDRHSIVQS